MINEKGVIPIIALALLLFFIVATVVAFVVSLDSFMKEEFSESLFSEDAEITPMVEGLRERKEAFQERKENLRERLAEAGVSRPTN